MTQPNKSAFQKSCEQLKAGQELTLEMIGNVYGQPFWIMIVYLFLDANDAARAIQGAVNRLRAGGKEDLDEAVQ